MGRRRALAPRVIAGHDRQQRRYVQVDRVEAFAARSDGVDDRPAASGDDVVRRRADADRRDRGDAWRPLVVGGHRGGDVHPDGGDATHRGWRSRHAARDPAVVADPVRAQPRRAGAGARGVRGPRIGRARSADRRELGVRVSRRAGAPRGAARGERGPRDADGADARPRAGSQRPAAAAASRLARTPATRASAE